MTHAIAVAALPGVLFESAAAAMPDEQCDIHLTAELKPEMRDTSDGGFLSSLIQDQTAYRLELLRADDTSVVELELRGPGPRYRCEKVIETMRKDERVLSIRVDTNAARPASEANWPSSSGKSWGTHLSERGLGAVYWAVHHPEQAWGRYWRRSNPGTRPRMRRQRMALREIRPTEPLIGRWDDLIHGGIRPVASATRCS